MITNKEEKQLYDLFDKLSEKQKTDFLRNKGLFYASFINPCCIVDEKDIFDKINENDVHSKEVEDFVESIHKRLIDEKKVIVLHAKDLQQDKRFLYTNNYYQIIDSCNFDGFLILSSADNTQKSIEQFKEKCKKGFCASDLYSFNDTIAQSLLPKMLKQFRESLHGYPDGLTEQEWDVILAKLIWFCNEKITEKESDSLFGKSPSTIQIYKDKIKECSQLLGKYFMDLWD